MKWILPKDSGSSEHRDALNGSPFAVVCFLGANALGDEAGPIALPKVLKAVPAGR